MNELIYARVIQAGIKRITNKVDKEETYLATASNLDKLGELLVTECIVNLNLYGYDDAATQLMEHFGVK